MDKPLRKYPKDRKMKLSLHEVTEAMNAQAIHYGFLFSAPH